MKKSILVVAFLGMVTHVLGQFPMGGGERRAGQQNAGFPGMQRPGQQQEVQEVGDGRIKGSVIDSVTRKPVEFATIALYKKAEPTKPVDGTISDDFGKFILRDLPEGDYFIKISFIGYLDKRIDLPKKEKDMRKLNLDNTVLVPSDKMLAEVTVTGQKSLLEDKVDRLVYNADVDKTSQGGNAGDVLRKVPMLSVDLDGNLSMRGSQNVRVLINNKPSTIMATSVADALRQIPAEMIKTVEVITSPSAKYDAEGTAGIVNIITKKNTMQGLTGNVQASLGNRGSNLMGSLNYRQGKFGVNTSGGGNMFYNPSETVNTVRTILPTGTSSSIQNINGKDNGLFGNWFVGADYDINTKNNLSTGVRFGQREFNSLQNIASTTAFNNVPASAFNRSVDNVNQNASVDINLDYVRRFENPQKEFGILAQISQGNSDNSFMADILNNNQIIRQQKNVNDGLTRELTLQTDFQTPIQKNQIFEIGAKNIYRNITNNILYYLSEGINNYLLDPRYPARDFNLGQNVASGYLSYTYTTGNKFSFKPGVRYEYTSNDAVFNTQNLNVANYGNVIPSMQISKSLGGGRTLKASYNRRIQRPSLRFLSPNLDISNPLNVSTGNPSLLPELTDAFELGLSTFRKATSLNASLFYRNTTDAITQVRSVTETGGILSQFLNIGRQQSVGVNLFFSTRIGKMWQLNLSPNAYYQYLTNPATNETNKGFVVDGNFFLTGQLPKGLSIQSFGFMRGPQVQLQGRQAGFGFFNAGIRKEFTYKSGNKFGIGLSVDNPFARGLRFISTFESPTLSQEFNSLRINRGVRLALNYQFGKMSFNNMGGRKRRINNDDAKQDDSGSQGGGAPR